MAHLVGFDVGPSGVRSVVAVVALAAVVPLGAWLLWRSPELGVERSLGLVLLALVLLGPILWPWYLTWGLAVLAPTAGRWTRRAVIALAVGGALVGAAAVVKAVAAFAALGLAGELSGARRPGVALAAAPLGGQGRPAPGRGERPPSGAGLRPTR